MKFSANVWKRATAVSTPAVRMRMPAVSAAVCRSFSSAPLDSGSKRSLFGLTPMQWTGVLGVPAVLGAVAYFSGSSSASASGSAPVPSEPVPALDPNGFKPFVVKEVATLNHNTKIVRFALPEGTTELGLPTASAVVVRFANGTKEDGSPDYAIRPYTPIENPAAGYTGTFDLLVKRYPDGVMSTHIHSLQPGDTLEFKGPIRKLPYVKNSVQHVGMIAGGSGITPMLQIIQRVLSDPQDKTKLSLIFANVSQEDILLHEYFDKLVRDHPGQIEVVHTLSKPAPGWDGLKGHVNQDMFKKWLPAPGAGQVLFCGPPGMMNFVTGPKGPKGAQGELGGLLKQMGYTENDVYKF